MGSESCHSPKHQGAQAKHSPSFSKVMTESALSKRRLQCGGCGHPALSDSILPCSALCIHWGRMTEYFCR